MGRHHDQVRGFAQYNLAMNQGLFDRIAGLGDAERKRDMAAFFGSIHGTFNHQTHHRGQIMALLNRSGHDSGVTDYLAYVQ